MGSRGGEGPRQRSREDGGGAARLGSPRGQWEEAPAHRTVQRGLPSLGYEGSPCGQPGAVEPAGCSRKHRDYGAHAHVLSQGELMPRRPPPHSSCLCPALPQTHTPARGGRSPDPTEATSSGPPHCPAAPSHTDARGHCSRGEQVALSQALARLPGLLRLSPPLLRTAGPQPWAPNSSRGVSRGQHPAQNQPRPTGWGRGPLCPAPLCPRQPPTSPFSDPPAPCPPATSAG